MLDHPEEAMLGQGFTRFVHPDDAASVEAAAHGDSHEVVFRMSNKFGEWRHLEAHVTDLRDDRHVRGPALLRTATRYR